MDEISETLEIFQSDQKVREIQHKVQTCLDNSESQYENDETSHQEIQMLAACAPETSRNSTNTSDLNKTTQMRKPDGSIEEYHNLLGNKCQKKKDEVVDTGLKNVKAVLEFANIQFERHHKESLGDEIEPDMENEPQNTDLKPVEQNHKDTDGNSTLPLQKDHRDVDRRNTGSEILQETSFATVEDKKIVPNERERNRKHNLELRNSANEYQEQELNKLEEPLSKDVKMIDSGDEYQEQELTKIEEPVSEDVKMIDLGDEYQEQKLNKMEEPVSNDIKMIDLDEKTLDDQNRYSESFDHEETNIETLDEAFSNPDLEQMLAMGLPVAFGKPADLSNSQDFIVDTEQGNSSAWPANINTSFIYSNDAFEEHDKPVQGKIKCAVKNIVPPNKKRHLRKDYKPTDHFYYTEDGDPVTSLLNDDIINNLDESEVGICEDLGATEEQGTAIKERRRKRKRNRKAKNPENKFKRDEEYEIEEPSGKIPKTTESNEDVYDDQNIDRTYSQIHGPEDDITTEDPNSEDYNPYLEQMLAMGLPVAFGKNVNDLLSQDEENASETESYCQQVKQTRDTSDFGIIAEEKITAKKRQRKRKRKPRKKHSENAFAVDEEETKVERNTSEEFEIIELSKEANANGSNIKVDMKQCTDNVNADTSIQTEFDPDLEHMLALGLPVAFGNQSNVSYSEESTEQNYSFQTNEHREDSCWDSAFREIKTPWDHDSDFGRRKTKSVGEKVKEFMKSTALVKRKLKSDVNCGQARQFYYDKEGNLKTLPPQEKSMNNNNNKSKTTNDGAKESSNIIKGEEAVQKRRRKRKRKRKPKKNARTNIEMDNHNQQSSVREETKLRIKDMRGLLMKPKMHIFFGDGDEIISPEERPTSVNIEKVINDRSGCSPCKNKHEISSENQAVEDLVSENIEGKNNCCQSVSFGCKSESDSGANSSNFQHTESSRLENVEANMCHKESEISPGKESIVKGDNYAEMLVSQENELSLPENIIEL